MLYLKHFVRQILRFLFWTDGLMQWHFEDTAMHQSQVDWMACFASDAFIILARHHGFACAFRLWFDGNLCTKINCMLVLLLSLYQFSVMCFPLSDSFFPSIGKWWMHGEVEWVHQCNITICQHHSQFCRHLVSSKNANNLKSCHWYQLMNNH